VLTARHDHIAEDGDETGFTLVELLVSMTILLVVLGSLLSVLESLTTSERRTSSRVDTEQAARLTLTQLARDLRESNPVQPQPDLTGYSAAVDVLLDGPPPQHIRWAYDPARATLTRYAVAGDGSQRATAVLGGVVNGAEGPGVFTWLDAAGRSMAAQTWATPDDVARCAREINVLLVLAAPAGLVTTTQTAQTALRNQASPEGCR
jgi:prepilin-type N-terminal cleavage/methylation domain-containing protein